MLTLMIIYSGLLHIHATAQSCHPFLIRLTRAFRGKEELLISSCSIPQSLDSSRSVATRAQPSDGSNCFRSDIGGSLGAGADTLADSGPDRQLLAEAPVIPALRVPARELARRPGEPAAAAERHPGRSVPTAPRLPRDTDAVDAASGP